MQNLSVGMVLLAAVAAAVAIDPAAAQIPTSPGQRLAPQNDSEQQLSDVSVEAATTLANARAAAEHCNPAGLADAVKRLQQLEQQSRRAAAGARAAGQMTAVRPAFADSIHDTIAGELRDASALKANCPKPDQQPAQTAPPQTNPPPPPPPVELPAGSFIAPNVGTGQHDILDELEDQADDAVDDYWAAYGKCDKDGMKRALDKLRSIADQVHDIHQAATAAGSFGRFSKGAIEDMIDFEEDIDDFVDHASLDVPKCPLPERAGQTGASCPAPSPSTPRHSLLGQSLRFEPGYIPRLTGTRYSEQILDYHNSLRLDFGSPKLQWNPVMAAGASAFAKSLAETGVLQHSPRTGRENERENLSLSPHGTNTIQTMLDGWGMERRYYTAGTFPNVSSTGNWMSVAHYTQIVWPTTTQLGCGFYAGARYDALVCRYSPPGNADGKPLVPRNPCFFVPPPPPPPPAPPAPLP